MKPAGKLITVSFRLPYQFSAVRAKLTISPSVGGLATALCSYFDNKNGARKRFNSLHWIGVSDITKEAFDKVSLVETVEKDNLVMYPVFLPTQLKEKFHDGFCNSVLWPLFLYFPSFVVYKKEFFEEYSYANELIFRKVMEIYAPGDTIWVHDYHWMLLPSMLREALPDARIGFFLHIPFPSFELYRLLPKPWREQLILGLTGADVIGFQTPDYADHFMDSVGRALPTLSEEDGSFTVNNRTTIVTNFSSSIDYEKFNTASQTPRVRRSVKRIREELGPRKLILSVDRFDYSKAILNRLEAFELFLEQNDEFMERVTYILLMIPTRELTLKYKENKLNVEALITRINNKYGTPGWTPLMYHYQTVDFEKLVALYCVSDIALIVPSRDGMNLVAKEFIASRSSSDGVLILSETAGAAVELTDAIVVNSNDRQEIADSILEAILMSGEEQKKRIGRMQTHIIKNDVIRWASDFLNSVNNVVEKIEVEV